MDYRKKKWNNKLKKFFISTALGVVTFLIAILVVPMIQVNAANLIATRTDLANNNIHFVAAKTKARTADELQVVQYKNKNGSLYSGYAYAYNSNRTINYYDAKTGSLSTSNSDVNTAIATGTSLQGATTYTKIDTEAEGQYLTEDFIPANAEYFDNVEGNKEKIFGNEVGNNDFVLLNNYNSHLSNPDNNTSSYNTYNVENFYLAFGAPFNSDGENTLLNSVVVTARLLTTTLENNQLVSTTHNLVLNPSSTSDIPTSKDGHKARYWSQFFDLNTLTAIDDQKNFYNVDNPQGKYEFKFEFITYNKDLSTNAQTEFNYSFYLLDGSEYTKYPTIYNADILNNLKDGSTNEYFYNFTKENPYIEYDPTKFNLSYTRVNNKSLDNISHTITSYYSDESYTMTQSGSEGIKFTKGVLKYYQGSAEFKRVYILTNYNSAKSIVETSYLSANSAQIPNLQFSSNTYAEFENHLALENLTFEYKTTMVLDDSTAGTYVINTYKTEKYAEHSLTSDFDTFDISQIGARIDSYTFKVTKNIDNSIKVTTEDSDSNVVNFGTYTDTDNLLNLDVQNGVIVDLSDFSIETTIDQQNPSQSKYTLSSTGNDETTKTYTLTKLYYVTESIDNGNEIQVTYKETQKDISLTIDSGAKVYEISDPVNNNIKIQYVVEEKTATDGNSTYLEITSIKLINTANISVSNLSSISNMKLLKEVLNIENYQLSPVYSYQLKFDQLGIYNFSYSYVCPTHEGVEHSKVFVSNALNDSLQQKPSNSTNFTTPTDFAINPDTTTTPAGFTDIKTNEPVYIVVSAPIGSGTITVNGVQYQYANGSNQLSVAGSNITLGSTVANVTVGGASLSATYSIKTIAGQNHLNIAYNIGSVNISEKEITNSYKLKDKDGYRIETETITKYVYTLTTSSATIGNGENAKDIVNALKILESYTDSTVYTTTTSTKQTNPGKDTLHIYGSIAYFNKSPIIPTDSSYAKLEQVSDKNNQGFISDVTQQYFAQYVNVASNAKPANYDYNNIDYTNFKGKIATLRNKNNIIITDVTPVLWNNFSTLSYNGKISQSYIYRYTKYKFDNDGNIIPGSACQTSTFGKDVYCQFDGLYEVVIFYTYENLPSEVQQSDNKVIDYTDLLYYQVFTFIIDNSSPELNVLVDSIDENGNNIVDNDTIYIDKDGLHSKDLGVVYENLGLANYTNRNVRLMWKVPTYFQNDIFIEVNRKNYSSEDSGYNFNGIFKYSEKTITGNASSTLVDSFITMGKLLNKDGKYYYYLDIKDSVAVEDGLIDSVINGKYKITLHYGASGKSTFTEEFTIDKQEIDGLSILPIVKTDNGNYVVNTALPFDTLNSSSKQNTQLINRDFTFRFNKKDSSASIFVYYDKISLASYEEYDRIINSSNNTMGITTKSYINGNNITIGTQYNYAYTHYNYENMVNNENVITSNSSCIYLFRLKDEAGNECRYVIFYDKTDPRFLTAPEPRSSNRVVNSTTRAIWGDYKAIKILSDAESENNNDALTGFIADPSKGGYVTINNSAKVYKDIKVADEYLNTADNIATTLSKGDKVHILSWDEDSEYTQITYTLPNTTTITGYINTKYIQASGKVTNYTSEQISTLPLVLGYMNSNPLLFKNIKIEAIVENGVTNYYALIPISDITIEDNQYGSEAKNTTNENLTEYYFFPTDPKNSDNTITLPVYNADGSINSQAGDKTYTISGTPTYLSATDFDGTSKNRYVNLTYTYQIGEPTTTATKSIAGAFGEGVFIYNVKDATGNISSGLIWMNLDRTETMGLGTFNYSDNVDYAQTFINSDVPGTYAASNFYVSSIPADETNGIPTYSVTYKHFEYNAEFYSELFGNNNLSISNISLKVDGNAQFMIISLSNETQLTIQLKDADGNDYPRHSYPYDLQGSSEKDVYEGGFTTKTEIDSENNSIERKYSLTLNATTDINKKQIVSEEGLYIVKREYDATLFNDDDYAESLKNDKRIVYRVFYIDRSGIINIDTSNSVANKLYEVGTSIGFTLGADYNDEKYKKVIDAKSIQNNQTENPESTTSNASYNSYDLFSTNKVLVEFTRSFDKHDFNKKFANTNFQQIFKDKLPNDTTKSTLSTALTNYLFNERFYEDTVYKLDMSMKANGAEVINEQNDFYTTDTTYFTTKTGSKPTTLNTNKYWFFYDTSSNYYIGFTYLAGYYEFDSDGKLSNKNANPNTLNISFDISHDAPVGQFYGKYYARENYDEDTSELGTGKSIPQYKYEIDGKIEQSYGLLTEYMNGQLDPLSSTSKNSTLDKNGNYVQLYSTNNETLIFTFAKTNDTNKAQIDPNNIKIYKGQDNSAAHLIFNIEEGNIIDTTGNIKLSRTRQGQAFFRNVIDNTIYYAIVIFDNNLDEILSEKEKTQTEYGNYRLLTAEQNNDFENYYIHIQYVGDEDNYAANDDNSNEISFYDTTYEITIDRIKPTYNLTKLMTLDKYVYVDDSTKSQKLSYSNYNSVFENYAKFYNYKLDESMNYYRSDFEKYFFALDCREESSFVFEHVSELDNANNGSIYLRKVNKDTYKFSVTPDDYKAYYTTEYLSGHPQFTPSTAKILTQKDTIGISADDTNPNYYKLSFGYDNDNEINDGLLYASNLLDAGIFEENSYYEIIEEDEAGNYRVYAVYIPQQQSNEITYTFKKNSQASSLTEHKINFDSNSTPYKTASGMELQFTNIKFKDNFLRANLTFTTNKFTHLIDIILNPNTSDANTFEVYVINRTTGQNLWTLSGLSKDKVTNGSEQYTNTDLFIQAINDTLDYYYEKINNSSDSYYSEFGYTVQINIIDRIGVKVINMQRLYYYEITYNVAGSILIPKFIPNTSNFTIRLSGKKGSTYITSLVVEKFNKKFDSITADDSNPSKTIITPIYDETDYIYNRGVYRFTITDNFERKQTYFYEYGISASQTGGSLKFSGPTAVQPDGYTYSSNPIEYTFDNSVYNVYIKFTGKIPDEIIENEYTYIDNVIYISSNNPTNESLAPYGISTITSGNQTTIKFAKVDESINLSKYHIKTILASTSTNYTWDKEKTDNNVVVHNKQIALYSAIQYLNIKNLSGTPLLDTKEGKDSAHLNLTEDFELVAMWPENQPSSERLDFNARIILTRSKTPTEVHSGIIISEPGDYSAYIINDLGMKSKEITFTRGEGEISMYSIYAVDSKNSTEKTLTPSSLVSTISEGIENSDTKILFTYYTTDNYFNYKINGTEILTKDNIDLYSVDPNISSIISINTSANKYIDVRVNSNLSIKTEISEIGKTDSFGYPYIQYIIYSKTKTEKLYTYRFVRIVFVPEKESTLTDVTVNNAGENTNLATTSVINTTSPSVFVKFNPLNVLSQRSYVPVGDTLYVERYYNGELIETKPINISSISDSSTYYSITLENVGLHEFIIRDLAGRIHKFPNLGESNATSNKLRIYLINQILYKVNNNNPIQNQIFNEPVNVEIVYSLPGLTTLYNARLSNITVTKNGQEYQVNANSEGKFTISEPGYYSIKFNTTTSITNTVATPINSIFNFTIVDSSIATRTFSLSKGTNFTIEKIIKIIDDERYDITTEYPAILKANAQENGYDASNLLIYLSHK